MTNTKRLFLDIHALQTLPPSNVNRDDTGSPKTAQYGGVRRARVSSQSWKRAIRLYFKEFGDTANVGVRTLDIVNYLADKIIALSPSKSREEAMTLAEATFKSAGVSTKDQRAKALFFLGDKQAEQLAQAALAGESDKKALQAILSMNPAIDIALFGRMVADDPSLNEDASAQVAHAISTHGIQSEFDFFTGVDDRQKEDNAGAGMLGTIEFNSSTLYRYANVAVHEFIQQIGDQEAAAKALNLFIEAFVKSMPTGKANTFANQTLPQAVVVTLRTDRPVNLVSAFEKPVRSGEGFAQASAHKLEEEFKKVESFVQPPLASMYVAPGLEEELADLGQGEESLTKLQDEVYNQVMQVSFE
ncbi:type I-E CRISPR-associated protein Cas7/Cse4/CasC [Peptococcus simiae]|uniref:Type I-E CRISPR-associated protein Cas7/Cse4/CasC n=1 Tax=Peptococcus simiae TaxID=1643805 RepID=A0ABW9GY82_9FIRM